MPSISIKILTTASALLTMLAAASALPSPADISIPKLLLPRDDTAPATPPDTNTATDCIPPTCNPAPETAPPAYTPGWCTFHITQFQPPTPASYPTFSLTLYDGAHAPLTAISNQPVTLGLLEKSLQVHSRLPFPLVVSAGKEDDAPVMFSYGKGQSWLGSDAGHCKMGFSEGDAPGSPTYGYEGGKREGDCGFSCGAPEQ